MPEEKDVYEEIIDDNSSENKKPEPEVEETNQEKSEPRIITEADVRKLGLSKTFVGKPYDDTIATVIKAQGSWNTQLFQQIKNLQKEFQEMKNSNTSLTKQDVKEVKEEVEDQLDPMPDALDKPAEFKAWLEKRDALTEKKILKHLDEKMKGTSDDVGKLKERENQIALWDNVEGLLKELYTDGFKQNIVEDVMKEYEEYLNGLPEKEADEIIKFYTGKPTQLARQILIYHKSQNFGKKEEKKDTSKEHDEKVEKLKNKTKKFTEGASSPRNKTETENENDPYQQIINEGKANLALERTE